MEAPEAVVVFLKDLMFQVKIADAAKRAGVAATFASGEEELLRMATAQHFRAVILDLNLPGVDVLGTITRLKGSAATRTIPLIGYVSHVQTELRKAAAEAGCDTVLARSAFVQELPQLLLRLTSPINRPTP